MEKLLNLLKEYKPIQDGYTEYCSVGGSIWIKQTTYSGTSITTGIDEIILSKKFGFIKWLIENDKIKKPYTQILKDIDVVGNNIITGVDVYDTTDSLLMLLSIQDNPINFLISVLK